MSNELLSMSLTELLRPVDSGSRELERLLLLFGKVECLRFICSVGIAEAVEFANVGMMDGAATATAAAGGDLFDNA